MMTSCFHLTPKNLDHKSWEYSITTKSVYIFASAEIEARWLVANTLCNEAAKIPLRTARYQKKMLPAIPWELDDVTSCEQDTSNRCLMNYVVADDGEKWRIKYKPDEC
jgi:hypothetical protein